MSMSAEEVLFQSNGDRPSSFGVGPHTHTSQDHPDVVHHGPHALDPGGRPLSSPLLEEAIDRPRQRHHAVVHLGTDVGDLDFGSQSSSSSTSYWISSLVFTRGAISSPPL